MRKLFFFGCLAALSLGSISAWGRPGIETIPATPVGGKVEWIYDYADGQKLSRETGRPMFVVFRCER